MSVVKRLTKDYFSNLFEFYRKNRINIIKDEIFNQWLDNLISLKEENNSYFSDKYEFFFSGNFDDDQELNMEGAAVLKKCKSHSATVKSLVFKKNSKGDIIENELKNIVKSIEIYCAESGIKTIDFYTNSKNNTSNYFLNLPTKYFMLFKRRIDNEANYEYIFRRKILIDYIGDPTNIRDLSLWFLDSVFIPYPNIEDSSSIITIQDIRINESINFFTDISCYQTGLFEEDYLEIPFKIISKSCMPDILETTTITLIAFILNNYDASIINQIQDKISRSNVDKFLVFSTKYIEFNNKKLNLITWETIIKQIKYIHQQYEPTYE